MNTTPNWVWENKDKRIMTQSLFSSLTNLEWAKGKDPETLLAKAFEFVNEILKKFPTEPQTEPKTKQKEPQQIIPTCSLCDSPMNKVQWGWSCKNWKEHKERGEKPEPIFHKNPPVDPTQAPFN